MTRYSKGARTERELLNELHDKGYSVMRSAGSGVNTLSPDLIAIKGSSLLAFECKAWDRSSVAIESDRYANLLHWERNTGMSTFIAWRMSGEGWFFIKTGEMSENRKSWSITKKNALQINRRIESIIQI